MFCSSGQKEWCLFFHFDYTTKLISTFALSSKTEVGSAGEQPIRDYLDVRQISQSIKGN